MLFMIRGGRWIKVEGMNFFAVFKKGAIRVTGQLLMIGSFIFPPFSLK